MQASRWMIEKESFVDPELTLIDNWYEEQVTKYLWVFLLVILMLLPVRRVYAQSEDFATWTGVKVSHKVAPRWSLSAATEFRSKDH